MDRLSELPDSLILEILSLLPMTDVVATMLLSKRWLDLWTTVPCLKFKDKYKKFVSGALAHWRGSKIRKFSITFDRNYVDFDTVDSWLLYAVEKQVEELRVSCDTSSLEEYCPPQPLYSCSSITKMLLAYCELRIDEPVQWSRLKRLEIRYLDSIGDNDALSRIFAGAPLLEELVLEHLNSRKNLNIRSTSLKILKFAVPDYSWFTQVLRIWAPNLLDLEIFGCFYGTCFLDVPSLKKANIFFIDDIGHADQYQYHHVFQSIRHVEKLTLSQFSIRTLFLTKHSVEFPNLKSLSFDAGYVKEMLGFLDMFPNVTTLWVQHDEDLDLDPIEELCEADLARPLVPHLKRVDITWSMPDESIIPALEILLENAKLLEKMVFRAVWEHDDKVELLLSKPASSPTAEVIIIHV